MMNDPPDSGLSKSEFGTGDVKPTPPEPKPGPPPEEAFQPIPASYGVEVTPWCPNHEEPQQMLLVRETGEGELTHLSFRCIDCPNRVQLSIEAAIYARTSDGSPQHVDARDPEST